MQRISRKILTRAINVDRRCRRSCVWEASTRLAYQQSALASAHVDAAHCYTTVAPNAWRGRATGLAGAIQCSGGDTRRPPQTSDRRPPPRSRPPLRLRGSVHGTGDEARLENSGGVWHAPGSPPHTRPAPSTSGTVSSSMNRRSTCWGEMSWGKGGARDVSPDSITHRRPRHARIPG